MYYDQKCPGHRFYDSFFWFRPIVGSGDFSKFRQKSVKSIFCVKNKKIDIEYQKRFKSFWPWLMCLKYILNIYIYILYIYIYILKLYSIKLTDLGRNRKNDSLKILTTVKKFWPKKFLTLRIFLHQTRFWTLKYFWTIKNFLTLKSF